MRQILPKDVADIICPKGSRLAHLYGLPKTHKPELAMRPILSATGTYNFKLAKWLDEKLKPISINEFTISDLLRFSEELRKNENVDGEILVSYDVSSLFTNVPVDETIEILVQKAFHEEWFNNKYNLALKESDLRALLNIDVSTRRKAIRADRWCGNGITARDRAFNGKYLYVLYRGEAGQRHGHAIFLPSLC